MSSIIHQVSKLFIEYHIIKSNLECPNQNHTEKQIEVWKLRMTQIEPFIEKASNIYVEYHSIKSKLINTQVFTPQQLKLWRQRIYELEEIH